MSAAVLSVVVPWVNDAADLAGALAALARERESLALEVLVPARQTPQAVAEMAARFPWVRLLPAPVECTIPELRALAFRTASAPAVAVIEDHVLVPEGWAGAMLRALESGAVAVGARSRMPRLRRSSTGPRSCASTASCCRRSRPARWAG
ncbi:MAG: hypothetical protein IPJ95_16850 [Gemmatimonadetes bacterium]|nr:hypothetical protein [Gemmatimonadota bacterium]